MSEEEEISLIDQMLASTATQQVLVSNGTNSRTATEYIAEYTPQSRTFAGSGPTIGQVLTVNNGALNWVNSSSTTVTLTPQQVESIWPTPERIIRKYTIKGKPIKEESTEFNFFKAIKIIK